jgi:hypothetical protein
MSSVPSPSIEVLRDVLRQGGDAAAALAAMVAVARASSSISSAASDKKTSPNEVANQEQDDGHEVEDEISYTPYKPTKLKYGRDHPDPVVENATLAAVTPPDVTYSEYNIVHFDATSFTILIRHFPNMETDLAMPSDIIHTGKLSNLQLEAVVYGCQRHMMDLPTKLLLARRPGGPVDEKENFLSSIPEKMSVDAKDVKGNVRAVTPPVPTADGQKREPPPVRAGFLLGDGAGMGKGRTLAGFVVENIARGRKKHVWISVSSDLYEG